MICADDPFCLWTYNIDFIMISLCSVDIFVSFGGEILNFWNLYICSLKNYLMKFSIQLFDRSINLIFMLF